MPALLLFHQAQLVGIILADEVLDNYSLLVCQTVLDNVHHDGALGRNHRRSQFKEVGKVLIQRLVAPDAEGVDNIVKGRNLAREGDNAVIDEIPVQQIIHPSLSGLEQVANSFFHHCSAS